LYAAHENSFGLESALSCLVTDFSVVWPPLAS
jgi:hypothetical protein